MSECIVKGLISDVGHLPGATSFSNTCSTDYSGYIYETVDEETIGNDSYILPHTQNDARFEKSEKGNDPPAE